MSNLLLSSLIFHMLNFPNTTFSYRNMETKPSQTQFDFGFVLEGIYRFVFWVLWVQ